jgi:transketolase
MSPRFERSERLAAQLRRDILRSTSAAGSGHATSSLSAADLGAILLCEHLRADDRVIFSKGHASPLLYAMMKARGVVSDVELMTYRRFQSPLQGHPVPTLPGIDVATGSLGQGLPIAIGMALSGKFLERLPFRVWVLLGDSEMSEGSIWEAFDHARYYGLGNIVAILDMNRLGQRGETPLGWNGAAYAARARAFGWRAIEIDGHDLSAIDGAYAEALANPDVPALVVARTIKGKGVPFLENKNGWHGKAIDVAAADKAIDAIGRQPDITIEPKPAPAARATPRSAPMDPVLPTWSPGEEVATRKAWGEALRAIGDARSDIVALDGEVSNSTFAEDFAKAYPEHYFEMFIAEQQMIGAAVGLSTRGWIPFASTFAAFLTRAFDFLRMASISNANIRVCGSHAGVSIGEDGPSQMGLEDVAMIRTIHGSTVLHPCCANQTAKLVLALIDRPGITYMRTLREKTRVLYDASESFPIGGSKVIRASPDDDITIIAAGVTVHEALTAHEILASEDIMARVIDAYSIKPIDSDTIRAAVSKTYGRVIVVEDHRAEGGLGDAVRECLSNDDPIAARLVHLAVRDMPCSGKPEELLHASGIDADAIVRAAERIASVVRRCFICNEPAIWCIAIAGEDELVVEEDACEVHARGHVKRARLVPDELSPYIGD